MTRIDFLIANAGHHLQAARPVAEALAGQGFECRLVSICEFRGLVSPDAAVVGLDVLRLVAPGFRRSPSRRARSSAPSRRGRAFLRGLVWHGLLARRVRSWLRSKPDVVTVPNDAAYPYDRICRELRRRGIRFVILQEGIRFADTVVEDSEILGQGLSGADAIACWGETSAEFFRVRGSPPTSIHLTGSPRFDLVQQADWSAESESLSKSLPPGERTLTILTNPIEVWGFCSEAGKMELLQKFLDGLDPLFERSGLRVLFKTHRQESLREYRTLVAGHPHADRMTVLEQAPLYPLLGVSDAALVLASTVGLEALLSGVSLGVLEIPGHGFIHDFVSSGAARGISWSSPIADQVQSLLDEDPARSPRLAAYIDRSLSCRGRAAAAVANLIASLATQGEPTD